MRIFIQTETHERQGGVTTYVTQLLKHFPDEVQVVQETACEAVLHVGPHRYGAFKPGVRHVVVVHDLIPELLWGDESVRQERRAALERADAVIAVSNWTKKDVVREYGIAPAKVRVVYHGVTRGASDGLGSSDGRKPYLLYVGKRNEYKRFRWMLRALVPFMWRHPSYRLVCTGEPFCRREIVWLLATGLWWRTSVKRYDDAELARLYAGAKAFVFPSSYEGFGLPLLEAMAAGCPVIASRSTCLPEVGGDAAAYFAPDDAADFRRVLKNVVQADKATRQKMLDAGYRRVNDFSWEKCARETAEVLKSVLAV